MSEIRKYTSTDHQFFCVKHRSHSVTYSLCPDCYEDLELQFQAARNFILNILHVDPINHPKICCTCLTPNLECERWDEHKETLIDQEIEAEVERLRGKK